MTQQLALILEDDPSLSRAYRRVLTDLGYDVEISETFPKRGCAFEILRLPSFSLISSYPMAMDWI